MQEQEKEIEEAETHIKIVTSEKDSFQK